MARRSCFVIAPNRDPGSAVGKRADQVFKHIIEPVASELSYRCKRADRMKRPGTISSQVLAAVVEADLVVADLSDHDANVFYELAIRHATRRAVVHLIDSEQELPFDVANMRTVHVDLRDLDSAAASRKQLKEHMRAAQADSSPVKTPLLAARAMRRLWHSKQPTDAFIGEALDELRALKQERLGSDQRAMPVETASRSSAELTVSNPAPDGAPLTAATVNLVGPPSSIAAANPSARDFGVPLFASTNESGTAEERDPGPAPRSSSRKSRKRAGDVPAS